MGRGRGKGEGGGLGGFAKKKNVNVTTSKISYLQTVLLARELCHSLTFEQTLVLVLGLLLPLNLCTLHILRTGKHKTKKKLILTHNESITLTDYSFR